MPTYQLVENETIEAFKLGEKGEPTPAPDWFSSVHIISVEPERGMWIRTDGFKAQFAYWGDYIIRNTDYWTLSVLSKFRFEEKYKFIK